MFTFQSLPFQILNMPRTYQKRQTGQCPVYDPGLLRQTIDAIVKNEIRFAYAVKEYGIPKTTLREHLNTKRAMLIFNSPREQIIKVRILYLSKRGLPLPR